MSKIVKTFIIVSIAWLLGFAMGAMLTKPSNLTMERIVEDKKHTLSDLQDSVDKIEILENRIKYLEQQKLEEEKIRQKVENELQILNNQFRKVFEESKDETD